MGARTPQAAGTAADGLPSAAVPFSARGRPRRQTLRDLAQTLLSSSMASSIFF